MSEFSFREPRPTDGLLVGRLDAPLHLGELSSRVAVLEAGVKGALDPSRLSPDGRPIVEDLVGDDGGLYARLVLLAQGLGYAVVDDDALTKDILRDGRKGLNMEFYSGPTLMIKQGPPLQMAATLGHEIGHHWTPDIYDEESCAFAETVAEGAAFVVCHYNGLDLSPQVFPYIAGYNNGIFTTASKGAIQDIGTAMIGAMR